MKKEIKQELKPLMYYIEKIPSKEIDKLYKEIALNNDDLKNKKVTKEEKIELIHGLFLSQYALAFTFLGKEALEELKKLINGEDVTDLNQMFADNYFVFETENGYEIPKELVEAYNKEVKQELSEEKKNILLTYYLYINGLIEVSKLVELLKESGYKITKTDIKKWAKEKEIEIKNDVLYSNFIAEMYNEEGKFLELKNMSEYKVSSLEDIIVTMTYLEMNNYEEKIQDYLKKKMKNISDLEEASNVILNIVSACEFFEENVEACLKDYNVKLTKKEKEEFFDLLTDICYEIPSWILNGFAPSEKYNHECEDCDCEDCNCDEHDSYKELDEFDFLEKEEKIEACINLYLMINGIIEIDKLIEIMNNNYDLKTNKKEVIKIAKTIEDTYIIDNYLSGVDFDKETFLYLLALKGKKDYYIIKNFDAVYEEIIDLSDTIEEVLNNYNFDDDAMGGIFVALNMGDLSEDYIAFVTENHNIDLSLKKQRQLFNELRSLAKDYRSWNLNGYKISELNKVEKKEKIGRNDKCLCGSGKKYKQCCGK